MNILAKYGRLLEEKPYKTKCITAFCTFGLGDILCQTLEIKYSDKKTFNFLRTFRQASFGFLFTPFSHIHFSVILPKLFPSYKKYSLISSVIYDQTVFATFFTVCFFGYIDTIEGKTFQQSLNELKGKFMPTMITNWSVWPFLMLFNFYYVPVAWRVLFGNICGIFWTTYLSYVQNVKAKKSKLV